MLRWISLVSALKKLMTSEEDRHGKRCFHTGLITGGESGLDAMGAQRTGNSYPGW